MIRALLKNNVALLVQYGAGAAMPLLLVPHLARTIGLEAFGTLSVMLAWATYASALVHYAFHLTGPAFAAREPAQVPRLVSAILQARMLLLSAALVALGVSFGLGAIPSTTLAAGLLILVLMPVAAALETTWHLQVRDRFVHTAALSVAGTALAVWFGFAYVRGEDAGSISWAAAALVAGAVVVSTGSLLLSLQMLRTIRLAAWSEVRSTLRDGRPIFASQIVALAYGGSGPIIIGWIAGMEQAGSYAVLARLVIALCVAAELLHTAAYPTLARFFVTDRLSYLKLVRSVVLAYLAFAVAIGLIGWTFREPVLAYLFGASDASHRGLYLLCLLWVASGIFGSVVTGYFVVSGQAQRAWQLNLVALSVSLVVGIPGIAVRGASGWVLGLLAGQAVIAMAALQLWNKERMRPVAGRAA